MNNTSDSNKRRKKIVSGTASVKRRDDKPVGTSGPVGRKDGYQGRKAQYGSQNSSGSSGNGGSLLSSLFGGGQQSQNQQSQSTQDTQPTYSQQTFTQDSGTGSTGSGRGILGSGLGKILILILLAVAVFFLFRCICSGSGASQSAAQSCSILDLLGGESGIIDLAGSNTYDVSDSSAASAISASTSTGEANYTVSNKARGR